MITEDGIKNFALEKKAPKTKKRRQHQKPNYYEPGKS